MEFYGYKRCSTCRKAYQYLALHGVDVEFHDFVAHPPSAEQLQAWVAQRGEGVQPFINRKGTRYRELGLADQTLTDAQWIELLSKDGRLIKRPVLITAQAVVIGFHPGDYDRVLAADRALS